jgi:hypothetical protein
MVTQAKSTYGNTISWIFSVLFFLLGILNLIWVHAVPGFIYIVLGCLYLPVTNSFLNKKMGFTVPLLVKIIFGVLVLWGTLAVGDLMELFEAKFL